jgi:hypothetical protein
MRAIEVVVTSLCAAVQEGRQSRPVDKDAAGAAEAAAGEAARPQRPRRTSRPPSRAEQMAEHEGPVPAADPTVAARSADPTPQV